jgi:hypothetical protein
METHLFPLGYGGGGRGEFDRVHRSKLAFSRDAPGFCVGHIRLERYDPDYVKHDAENGVHGYAPCSGYRAAIGTDRSKRAVSSSLA